MGATVLTLIALKAFPERTAPLACADGAVRPAG
jgi:hypothetical protein